MIKQDSLNELIPLGADGKPIRSKYLRLKSDPPPIPNLPNINDIMDQINIKRSNYYSNPNIREPLIFTDDEIIVSKWICETKGFFSLKDIGFSGFELSMDGKVKNLKTGYITQGSLCKTGYRLVGIKSDAGKSIKFNVHTLVAKKFLGAPPSDKHKTVDHMDNDRENNYVYNLRWATYEQQNYNKRTDKKRECKPVLLLHCVTKEIFMRFDGSKDAAKYLGVSAQDIKYLLSSCNVINNYIVCYDLRDYVDYFGVPEEWRSITIRDYGILWVSSIGRIYSRKKAKTFGHKNAEGRMVVGLRMPDGSIKTRQVHRLVALAFIGEPDDDTRTQVDHFDGICHNNHYRNLRYVSGSENTLHSYVTGNSKPQTIQGKCKPVVQLSPMGLFIREYPSIIDAATAIAPNNNNIKKYILDVLNRPEKILMDSLWMSSVEYFKDNPLHF